MQLSVNTQVTDIQVGVNQDYIKGMSEHPWMVQVFNGRAETERYYARDVELSGAETLAEEFTDSTGATKRKARIRVATCELIDPIEA